MTVLRRLLTWMLCLALAAPQAAVLAAVPCGSHRAMAGGDSAMALESMAHGGMDHASMRHGSSDHSAMRHASMHDGSMDHASMGHGSMDHPSVHRASMDHEVIAAVEAKNFTDGDCCRCNCAQAACLQASASAALPIEIATTPAGLADSAPRTALAAGLRDGVQVRPLRPPIHA